MIIFGRNDIKLQLPMKKINNYQLITISIHLLFWLMLLILMILVLFRALGELNIAIGAAVINLIGFGALVYSSLLWLTPKYFKTKQYWRLTLGVFILLILTSAFRFFIGELFVTIVGSDVQEVFTPSYFGVMFFSGIFILMLSLPLWLIDNWFKKGELEQELKTYQLEAELRFLKAQVNPHFLFNALNNIYSLSFTESKKTPEMILKLSDMMSYMLYDCKSEKVKLVSEIKYLHNYIALQQLKKDGEFNIEFNTSGDLERVMITPMLFIPFFENAFKHGNLDNTRKGWMKSELIINDGILVFNMSNTYEPTRKKSEKSGVGLENIRERLHLLYPNLHHININSNDQIFHIDLKINIK
jgi:sensor histidine kinase YesM